MEYEIRIEVQDKAYVDTLIIALARHGYAPYYNEDEGCVCYTTTEDEVTAIKGVGHED